MKKTLAVKEFKALADALLGTRMHIASKAVAMFPALAGQTKLVDVLMRGVEEHGGVFKCVSCDEWQVIAEERGRNMADHCQDCEDEITAEEGLEEGD